VGLRTRIHQNFGCMDSVLVPHPHLYFPAPSISCRKERLKISGREVGALQVSRALNTWRSDHCLSWVEDPRFQVHPRCATAFAPGMGEDGPSKTGRELGPTFCSQPLAQPLLATAGHAAALGGRKALCSAGVRFTWLRWDISARIQTSWTERGLPCYLGQTAKLLSHLNPRRSRLPQPVEPCLQRDWATQRGQSEWHWVRPRCSSQAV